MFAKWHCHRAVTLQRQPQRDQHRQNGSPAVHSLSISQNILWFQSSEPIRGTKVPYFSTKAVIPRFQCRTDAGHALHQPWRCEPESNRRTRFCSPLHNHSAIAPSCFDAGEFCKPSVRFLKHRITEHSHLYFSPFSARAARLSGAATPKQILLVSN